MTTQNAHTIAAPLWAIGAGVSDNPDISLLMYGACAASAVLVVLLTISKMDAFGRLFGKKR